MAYTLISFNLHNVYESSLGRDWEAIAQIIKEERADIVAVQEIFNEFPIKHLCRLLDRGFFSDWRFRMVSRETCRNSREEGYAFLWNAKRVELSPKEKIESDGRRVVVGVHDPMICTKMSRSLVRPPCVARFIPTGWCKPYIEMRIISTHIIFHEDSWSRNRGNELSDIKMRKEEYRALSERLFPRISKNRVDAGFRPAYTFIVGDYNLSKLECSAIDAEYKKEVRFMRTRQFLGSTISLGDGDKKPPGYTDHDYDHTTYSDREHQYVQLVERIDAPNKYYDGEFKKYFENVSDHAPIRMVFDVRKTFE